MPKGGQLPKGDWKARFLRTLEQTHMVAEACKTAGCSRAFIYQYRKRDQEFAQEWAEIEEKSTEVLEQVAVRRAVAGSDNLLMFLLKSRKPDTYRENVHMEHSGTIEGKLVLELPDGAQPIEIPASRRREAAQLLMQNVREQEAAAEEAQEEIPDAEVVEEGYEIDANTG